MQFRIILILVVCLLFSQASPAQKIEFWLTKSDQTALLEKQSAKLAFGAKAKGLSIVEIDENKTFQMIDGFGYSLTGGSALVINRLEKQTKQALLKELFGTGKDSIGISYLRISIGASDLNEEPFSYDDLPAGETDPKLKKFSLEPDENDLIPLLQEIVRLNPELKILGSPWSAPIWMKDNNSFTGGSLRPEFYDTYARYFVKYLREMEGFGIKIDAITPQNEPLHPGNNPSMLMTAEQQTEFIKKHLGPAFKKAEIKTKIIIYDHNCDKPEYPIEVLSDAGAREFIDGSAFHLYAGNITALSRVHEAFPDKNVYFTEQYTSSNGNFADDLSWHIKNVLIGATRNWSKIVLEWNLANDAEFKPHTAGGCDTCKGALTIAGNTITRNVSYYIIAHAAKFVPPESVRIESNVTGNLQNVAFKTSAGKIVLIVQNDGQETANFNIKFKNKDAIASLPAGAVGTFVW